MPNLRVLRPLGRWCGFQWSPSSLKSLPRLDTLDLTMASRNMTDDDLWEFLHPLQGLTDLSFSLLNSPHAIWWQELGSGALVPSVTSITSNWTNIKVIIPLLERRLAASRAAGGGITMFTSVSFDDNRPIDPALVPRLEALEAVGVRVKFLHEDN
ncbi:hypothetical protein BD779DRAFT_1679610 [Infundibulicybe gibba]|nr:hypothetical protein BD779DRAFT_1679610 [Infundibulicybe gibba]